MVFVNKEAIDRASQSIGENINVTHFTGTVSYDSDQNPTRSSTVNTFLAEIKRPNKFDVDAIGSDITIDDKKIIMSSDIDIDIGDQIRISVSAGSLGTLEVKRVQEKAISGINIRKIVFASRAKT